MSWNDLPNAPINQNPENQLSFLKIGTEVTLRILSDPEVYLKHFTFTITGKSTVIRCPGKDVCLICHREGKPKIRAMFIVLDRKDGNIKLYDAPQTVAAQIKSLMSVWGPPQNYDIIIKKLGNTKRTDYQVIQLPASQLSQAELDKIKLVLQNFNLKNSVRAHTPEEINAIITEQPIVKQTNVSNNNIGSSGQPNQTSDLYSHFVQPISSTVTPSIEKTQPNNIVVPPVAPMPTFNQNQIGQMPTAPGMPSQSVETQSGIQASRPVVPPGGLNPSTSNIGNIVDASYFNNFLK